VSGPRAALAGTLARARRAGVGLTRTGRVGLVLTLACVLVGLLGPFAAPYSPSELVGPPYDSPSSAHPLGLDYLGRDSLSRFLWGGRTALTLAVIGTALGTALGAAAGIAAGYARGWTDGVFNRVSEVLLAFPSLILVLLLVVAVGTGLWVVAVAVAVSIAPRTARIVRGATLVTCEMDYVEVAEARGERRSYILAREVLPNVMGPIAVNLGIGLSSAIILIAGVSFLGLGLQPPAADWGLIISENRDALTLQPASVAGPVVTIGLLTVGLNLMLDGVRRRRIAEARPVEPVRP
jgi:peptide/nickel transport system permease protein